MRETLAEITETEKKCGLRQNQQNHCAAREYGHR